MRHPLALAPIVVLLAACGGGSGDTPAEPPTGPGYARAIAGPGSNKALAVASFADGSFVVTGSYWETATFGAGDPAETDLTAVGINDIFVARYDADGTLAWARSAGSPSSDEGWSVATAPDGSCVVAGICSDAAVFGPGEPNQTTLNDAGGACLFVARYDPNGALLWARNANGTGTQRANAVAAFADGSSVVTGGFSTGATFAPGEGNQTGLVSAGSMDICIARYDADGSMAWVRQVGGTAFEAGRGVATYADGSLVVTGEFSGNVTFGPGDPNQTTLTDAGDGDVFVARYDATGTLVWARNDGGTDDEEGKAITSLPSGECVVTGFYEGTATFGLGEPQQTVLTANGDAEVFVARYDPTGMLMWAKSAGGADDEEAKSIAALSDGSVVVAGYTEGMATFGAGEANETLVPPLDQNEAFLARYRPNGTLAWVRWMAGPDRDDAYGVAGLPLNASVVVGQFDTNITFDAGGPNAVVLTPVGNQDGFVAVYDANGWF